MPGALTATPESHRATHAAPDSPSGERATSTAPGAQQISAKTTPLVQSAQYGIPLPSGNGTPYARGGRGGAECGRREDSVAGGANGVKPAVSSCCDVIWRAVRARGARFPCVYLTGRAGHGNLCSSSCRGRKGGSSALCGARCRGVAAVRGPQAGTGCRMQRGAARGFPRGALDRCAGSCIMLNRVAGLRPCLTRSSANVPARFLLPPARELGVVCRDARLTGSVGWGIIR